MIVIVARRDTLDTVHGFLTVSKGSRYIILVCTKRKKGNIIFFLNLPFLSISEKRLRFPLKLFLFKYSSHFSIIILLSISCHKTSVPIYFTHFKKFNEIIDLLPLHDKYTKKYRENISLPSFLSATHGSLYEKI